MIRTIPVDKLVPGMYVVDVHRKWFEHSLWRRRLLIRDTVVVRRLIQDGVTRVSIDTLRGLDLPPPDLVSSGQPSPVPVARAREEGIPAVSLAEERRRAAGLLREAVGAVQDLGQAARAGRGVETGKLEPLIGRMIDSVWRHPDALVPLARLKGGDAYPAEHAVACAALIIALARQQGLGRRETEALAVGALVKDIGQAFLDVRLMGREGELSRHELALVRDHVEKGLALLETAGRLPGIAVAVVREHHERFDGSGYPGCRAGETISFAGRMAAIVDTYDAMTSDRPYRPALPPGEALRRLYEEGGALFDPEMVAAFVHTVGIYPVGSLIRLASGHLGVVQEIHPDDLLRPVVKIIFHAGRRRYVTPVRVDLARRQGNPFGQIVRVEAFEPWGISPQRWQPA